jgi:formamidopyrimidine-DNA glycosylase
MPELPEVETVKIGLTKYIIGKTISKVEPLNPKSFPNAKAEVDTFLLGAHVTTITRRAKLLIIELSSGYSLVIHLKMTGQLVYRDERHHFGAGHPSQSLVGALPDNSTRINFYFSDESRLFFNDQRKFGWVKLYPTIEIPHIDFFKKVGPEPLDPNFRWKDFQTRLARRAKTSIKAALLDQTVIAGIGNIYADESLWAAKIHPATKVADLSPQQVKKLHQEIQAILWLSIENGGSTDRNYINVEGKKGSYLKIARVFRREGQACPRCGTEIIKMRVAGRGTHICPHCQRLK